MTLDDLRAQLATRAQEADAIKATAPLADTFRWVLEQLAAVPSNGTPATPAQPSRQLTAPEAAARLGVSVRWLYRHAKTLPFARYLGEKTLRFDEAGLDKHLKGARHG